MLICSTPQQLASAGLNRIACACGVFDGLHLGHRDILDALKREADAEHAAPVVMTFKPHPRAVLSPERHPGLLLSHEHKLRLLGEMQLAATVVIPFTPHFARCSPETFVEMTMASAGAPVMTTVCVGEAWRFGDGGGGDVALLARLGARHGFRVVPVPLRTAQGRPISSTRIRQCLGAGDLRACERMLGRRFTIYGPVTRGRGIAASELDCPTANVRPDNEVYPPDGIYAAAAIIHDDRPAPQRLPGVCYLGYAPTFPNDNHGKPAVEIHIFDFDEDLYGRCVEVEFLEFLRQDRCFPDAASLARQIAADVAAARAVHRRAT